MSVWLSVAFACMINGSCNFIYSDTLPTEELCMAKKKEMDDFLMEAPSVLQFQSSCLKIDTGVST